MAASDAFTVYALDQSRTPKTIAKRLAERRAELAYFLAEGGAQDWGSYQRIVGTISGLDEAMAICADIEKQQEN